MRYAITSLLGLSAVFLLTYSLQAQSLTVAQADSLRLLLRTNKVDTNRVGALLRLSHHYLRWTLTNRHSVDTALVLANQAKVLSQQIHYVKGQQEALFQQGRVFIKQEKLGKVKRMLSNVDELTRIRLLLELGKKKLSPTYSQEANLDSAIWYFNQAERQCQHLGNQFWQQESQMLTGVAYVFKQDCQLGKASFMQAIRARQQVGDRTGELQAWVRWAATQFTQWQCAENFDSLGHALALAQQLGDRPRQALLLLMMGYIHTSDPRKAKQEALKALAIQKSIGYPAFNRAYHQLVQENDYLQHVFLANLLDANGLLSDIAQEAHNEVEAVFYCLEVVKDIERSNQQEDLDWPYFWMGNFFYKKSQHAKCLVYYQQSLEVSHRKGELAVNGGIIRRVAESLIKEGKNRQALRLVKAVIDQRLAMTYTDRTSVALAMGQCHMALKQYKLAEKYYLEAVAWEKKDGMGMGEPLSYLHITRFYVATAQFNKAAFFLRQTWFLFKSVPYNTLYTPLELSLLQFKVDSAQANYPSAIRYYQRYTALKDSLLNEKTNKQIAALEIGYQTSQKEKALLLRQKDITLLSEQSNVQQTQRNTLIGGTLLLATLLGLVYNRYRLKQRSNQLLEAQQQILQTHQQEIHQRNEDLFVLLSEKNSLLVQKDELLLEQERFLAEKERLLREIHHRVKNNLQVVMSLLNSQASYLSDKGALSAIQQSQHRVQAMALIHQKLYQTEGIARIPMYDYITELVAYLHESFNLPQSIDIKVTVDPIKLDVTQAVPLGLIINETITNALKYAFPKGREGTVQVILRELSKGSYELVIADDGIGLLSDYDPSQSRSLGMTLIRGFSEQLEGQLQIRSQAGLSIQLLFNDESHALES